MKSVAAASRIAPLSVRLARLACDLDEVVQEIAREPLDDGDSLLLAAPALHLTLALDQLEQSLYEVEKLDQSHRRRHRVSTGQPAEARTQPAAAPARSPRPLAA